jgi:hypothetical protein
MAQADSVPSAIRAPITGATSKTSTNRRRADRRHFSGGSDGRIISGEAETSLIPLWRELRLEAETDEQADPTKVLNRRRYQAITGPMPVSLYVVVVSYATVIILLGWLPWTILFILLLFSSSRHLRLGEFDTMPSARRGSSE